MRTSFQSSSLVFSTIAQPCSVGLAVLVEHQAIARLPDRVFDDVADLHRPLSFAGEVEADGCFFWLLWARGQHVQGAAEFAVERRVEEAQTLHLATAARRACPRRRAG